MKWKNWLMKHIKLYVKNFEITFSAVILHSKLVHKISWKND